ncbi:hypothetical protein MMC07_005400 [Pseudocyphellaria aurata]|nr:hypothetical protein [Pseudocyphellaria aurata]
MSGFHPGNAMAYVRLPADSSPHAMDDPWSWGVEKVVETLCDLNGPMLGEVDPLSIPDPAFLAKALRENAVNGPTLLTELSHPVMRDDLGLKPLGHRTTLMHMIMDLRRQSARYLQHLQTSNMTPYSAGFGQILSFGQTSRIVPPLTGAPFQQLSRAAPVVSETLPSPFKAIVHGHQTAGRALLQNYPATNDPAQTMYEPPRSSIRESELVLPDRKFPQFQSVTGSEDRVVDGGSIAIVDDEGSLGSQRAHSPETLGTPAAQKSRADSVVQEIHSPPSDIGRPGETIIIDEHGKKRRRLVLAPIELILTTSEEIPPAAEGHPVSPPSRVKNSVLHFELRKENQIPNDEPMEQSSPVTPAEYEACEPPQAEIITATPPKDNDRAGIMFIDERGRKRLKPVLITQTEHEDTAENVGNALLEKASGLSVQLLTPSSETSSFKPSTRQNMAWKTRHVYLGAESFPIDRLFYGNTKIGQEMKQEIRYDENWHLNVAENSENFAFAGISFGNGQRTYVNARIRHFLYSRNIQTFKSPGKVLAVQIPYPDSFGKKHQQLSATVYSSSSDGIIASRMDRSRFDREGEIRGDRLFMEEAPGQGNTELLETHSDANWDFLKKWDFKAGEDRVLPVYGDSGSENEYDLDTWLEMEEEEGRKIPRPLRLSTRRYIDSVAIEHAINEAIEHIVEHWTSARKPKLLLKSWKIWKKARKDRTVSDQTGALTRHIQHLETRLSNLKLEILREDWSSSKEVMKQCKCLEETIFDREDCSWRVSILKLKAAPEKPSAATRKSKKPKTKSSQVPVEGSCEDVFSKESASESSDEALDDFIDDEHIDDANTGFVNEEWEPLLGVPQSRRDFDHAAGGVHDTPESDTDEASSESDEAQPEEFKTESLSAVPKLPPEARRKIVLDTLRTTPSKLKVDFIDLTQLSESSEVDSSPGTSPLDLTLQNSSSRKKRAVSKQRPTASSIVHIESDSTEYSTAREEVITSPVSSLPEFEEVEKIGALDGQMLAERKDRKRLLIWVIGRAKRILRGRIIEFIKNKPFDDIAEVVWVAFSALSEKRPKITGVDREESNAWLLLATWYVSWTIPVKVKAEQGIPRQHLKAAQKDHDGFLPFYEFLNKCLIHYEPKLPMTSAINSKNRESKNPKRKEIREWFDETLERTPHKKRKFAVPESQEAIDLRQNARDRFNEKTLRTKKNLRRRFKEMGANEDDSSMAVVNPGKLDDQAFIYINSKISSKMQPHQMEGVRFMWREVITDHQGCLLAQTMGLGKTMQVITLLVTIAEAASSPDENIRNQVPKDLHQSRTLILCPPALVENWWEEFLMWTPSTTNLGELRKVTADLKLQDRLFEIERWKDDGGVLLLGFNTFRNLVHNPADKKGKRILNSHQQSMVEDALLKRANLIVADEAHCAKTLGSGINKAINSLASMNRIALTGSPLANNLEEYYSLIDWIAPNYLGNRVEFRANYSERIQEGLYQDSLPVQHRESLKLLEVLKTELQPKVHRADITALQRNLMEKQEFVIRVPLTPFQKQIYEIYVDLMCSVSREDVPQSVTMWAWLSTLRLLCNHPKCFQSKLLSKDTAEVEGKRSGLKKKNEKAGFDEFEENDRLVDGPVSAFGISQIMVERQLAPFTALAEPHDSIALSNKMQILMEIIRFSKDIHDKVLVFSHSIDTLNYVEDKMQESGIQYSRIDGRVLATSRQHITKEFNSGSLEVCLISTRAGGQGLNLFGANRVIILDDHFNPMYEEQAIGRAYRIGQQKAVFVYHLMAGGTFEELLHNQSVFKQQLARRVVDKKNPARYAMRKIGDYLFHPKEVEQKDLGQFWGKDPWVLDRILNEHEDDPIIRSMDFTETFQREDTIVLTEEEKKEAEQLQKDEKLRRSDPVAYNDMINAKRNRHAFQAINPAFDSPGQGFPDFSPAVPSTRQEPHAFSIAATATGQRYPFLGYTVIPALPVSAATTPGGPPPALPEHHIMPQESSTRYNSAPPCSADDLLPSADKTNAPPRADGNEWATSLESNGNRIRLSPVLSASTTMMPRDTASPEKQGDPAISNHKCLRGIASVSDSAEVLAVDQAFLTPVLSSDTSMPPPETFDDTGADSLRRKRLRVTLPDSAPEPALNLNPYPPLQDLLSREAARMSKERPSSKT